MNNGSDEQQAPLRRGSGPTASTGLRAHGFDGAQGGRQGVRPGKWAVWQLRTLEDGKFEIAEAFLLGHGFANDMEARAFARKNGAVGEVYAIVELEGPFYRLLGEMGRLQAVDTRGEAV